MIATLGRALLIRRHLWSLKLDSRGKYSTENRSLLINVLLLACKVKTRLRLTFSTTLRNDRHGVSGKLLWCGSSCTCITTSRKPAPYQRSAAATLPIASHRKQLQMHKLLTKKVRLARTVRAKTINTVRFRYLAIGGAVALLVRVISSTQQRLTNYWEILLQRLGVGSTTIARTI